MARDTKIRERRTLAGRFRGGKLFPAFAVGLMPGEGGMISQQALLELDPVAGRLITPVGAQMISVFVPTQAMAALAAPLDPYAGVTEILRQKILDGVDLFPLEAESEVSKLLGATPISIGGVKMVSSSVRLAHNAAVNHLRLLRYTYAAQVAAENAVVTPALLSSTVLDLFRGVLNPDEHVNGSFDLDYPALNLPVDGLGFVAASVTTPAASNVQVRDTVTGQGVGGSPTYGKGWFSSTAMTPNAGEARLFVRDSPTRTGFPDVSAKGPGGTATISLQDFYNAQTVDRMTRDMRAIIDLNPVDGEEQIVRWAHGLQMDVGQKCLLLHETEVIFGQDLMRATDGAGIEAEVTQTRLMQRMAVTVPVPRTELGGVVITFLVVKPDETLGPQPHPVFTKPWVGHNLMAQELQNDPVAVTAREVSADVPQANELQVCFYTGYNELRRTYVNYGYNRTVDLDTVDVKNAMWQIQIPASVTPENIIYPEDISHYPFLDQDAEVVRYMISSTATLLSPIYIGPSPVETVAVIDDEDLFEKGEA